MARTPTPLHYYDLGSGQFNETSTYPFTRSTPTRLYFGAGGSLTSSAPAAAGGGVGGLPVPGSLPSLGGLGRTAQRPRGDRHDARATRSSGVHPARRAGARSTSGRWEGSRFPPARPGCSAPCVSDDQAAQAGPWATSYTTAPLSRAETVAGPITATVYASSTTSETQLVAELEDVTPSGSSYPLTEGALLGSLRAVNSKRSWTVNGVTVLPYHPYTSASSRPVTPGEVTEYQIQIFPTLATIAKGNRLRLTLSTTDTPHLTPLPKQLPQLAGGVYTIERSPGSASSLTVDLLP